VAGEEVMPPGPCGLIGARCQYRGEGGKRVSVHSPSFFPAAGGPSPPFIGQGDAVHNCAAQF
jgi:hypothetical protein